MSAPRWTRWLVRRLAPTPRVEDLLGDFEEAHRARVARRGRLIAGLLTGFEALDLAFVLLRERVSGRGTTEPARLDLSSATGRSRCPSISWLDVKLGGRMLARYPGLTLVGGLAMAFAVWVGAAVFEFAVQFVYPSLPLDEGDRVVRLDSRDVAANRLRSPSLHDFEAWREELSAVDDLGAFLTREANLITGDGRGEPVPVAHISAAGFRVARVPPLMGRTLVDADEDEGAVPVAVIGYDVWQDAFGADPEIVGRTIRLGRDEHTVVGVMPEGFAFPVADELWVPLKLDPLAYELGNAPRVAVFGRLAPGATLEQARAELTTLGLRAAADFPETHEHLRPEVASYVSLDLSGMVTATILSSTNLFVVALLFLLCGNVALLMFARAATREGEIAVRTALGASRGRIVGQLFAEALVLGLVAAAIGLAAAGYGLRWGISVVEAEVLEGGQLPFWFRRSLSPSTILYGTGLAVLGAVVSGVLPALRITGRGAIDRLRRASAGGGGASFGRLWSAAMVAQVAATVVFAGIALIVREDGKVQRALASGFSGEDYLTAQVLMDREPPPGLDAEPEESFDARYSEAVVELQERLRAEPAVADVTFADRLPRMYHGWRQIEVEGGMEPAPDERGQRVGEANVPPDFFAALGQPILSGRGFDNGDVGADAPVVLVNREFVTRVLGGRNPLGRRVRVVASETQRDPDQEPGPWHEIVGVVPDISSGAGWDRAAMYHPTAPGDAYPVYLALRIRGDRPQGFAPRLGRIAMAVDPTLRLDEVLPMPQVDPGDIVFYRFWFRLTTALSGVVLLLSLTAIYSALSFAVSRRTREIGVRVALGSDRRRIVLAIFRRPLTQVATGIVVGSALVWLGLGSLAGAADRLMSAGAMCAGFMAVCVLSCIVPTRRALAIEPTDALRADG